MRRTPPPKSSGTRNHCSISPAKVLKISAAANRIIRRQKGKNIRRAHPVSTVRPVLRPPHASVDYPAELRIDRLHELLVIVGGEPVLVEQQHTRQHAAKPLLHGSRLSGRVGSVGNAFRQTGFAQPAEEPRDKGRRLGTVAEAAEPLQKEELDST